MEQELIKQFQAIINLNDKIIEEWHTKSPFIITDNDLLYTFLVACYISKLKNINQKESLCKLLDIINDWNAHCLVHFVSIVSTDAMKIDNKNIQSYFAKKEHDFYKTTCIERINYYLSLYEILIHKIQLYIQKL